MAKVAFTAPRLKAFSCPANKQQAFLWDSKTKGLGLRTTPAGKPAFVFQGTYRGKTLRITIGSPAAWTIPDARAKAREYQRLIDQGIDPREQRRQALASAAAAKAQQEAEAITVAEAWQKYTAARAPYWGEHHKKDHAKQIRPPGATKAGKPTSAGPLYFFMNKRLAELTPRLVELWAKQEGQARPTQARLGHRLFRAFLQWCMEQEAYSSLLSNNPAATTTARQALGKARAKQDALLREQLPSFFAAVQKLSNPTVAAFIQAMLLTGARPGELLALKWEDVDTRWRSITLRDKDESRGGEDGTRDIPLTPYVWHLLSALPRRSKWVFSSDTRQQPINPPYQRLRDAARIAGIESITPQGLRRSFGSLSEWLEIPAGVIAQIQGHKPSATAERHYRVRPLDMLRVHHERFEAWMLEQAGIVFDAQQQSGGLQLVVDRSPQHG